MRKAQLPKVRGPARLRDMRHSVRGWSSNLRIGVTEVLDTEKLGPLVRGIHDSTAGTAAVHPTDPGTGRERHQGIDYFGQAAREAREA